jgi:hypothetical protein
MWEIPLLSQNECQNIGPFKASVKVFFLVSPVRRLIDVHPLHLSLVLIETRGRPISAAGKVRQPEGKTGVMACKGRGCRKLHRAVLLESKSRPKDERIPGEPPTDPPRGTGGRSMIFLRPEIPARAKGAGRNREAASTSGSASATASPCRIRPKRPGRSTGRSWKRYRPRLGRRETACPLAVPRRR